MDFMDPFCTPASPLFVIKNREWGEGGRGVSKRILLEIDTKRDRTLMDSGTHTHTQSLIRIYTKSEHAIQYDYYYYYC
jgi:hypothetical protein